MNNYTSLVLGLMYGIAVFLAVLGWMKLRRTRLERERDRLQPNLFGAESSKAEDEKNNEVAMAHHV
jgi:hypothetical protein